MSKNTFTRAGEERDSTLPNWVPGALGITAVFTLWWVVGALGIVGRSNAGGVSAIPTPPDVAARMISDGFDFYWRNAFVTLREATAGFLGGNALAIGTAALVLVIPLFERIAVQLAVITYCLPLVAIGPVIYAVVGPPPSGEPSKTAIALAALSVYFVTVVTTIQGLRAADRAGLDVVTVAGGNRIHQLFMVQLITAIPYVFTALKIAAPAAVLGAILGEFVGGVDRGLGPAMVSAQQTLAIDRLWALGFVAVALGGLAYAMIAAIGKIVAPWSRGGA